MSEATPTIVPEIPPEPAEAEALESPPSGRKLDPGFRRNLLIIGGAAAAVVGTMAVLVMWRSSSAADKPGTGVSVALPTGTTDVGTTGQLSPAMRHALVEKQKDERAAAQRAGEPLFIPRDTLAAAQPIASAPTAAPTNSTATQASPPPRQVSEEDRQRLEHRRAGMERQLGALMASADGGFAQPQRVQFDVEKKQASGATPAAAGGSSPSTNGQANRGPTVVDGLEILPAETASPIDTYRTKYASARIVGGKLNGAFLTGTTTLVEEGLDTRYTMMRFNGRTYAVDAKALDEKTSTDAMNADIDHRYLQRYVMPIGIAFVGGYATAAAQPGSQLVLTAGGAATASPPPDSAQARAAGVSAGMQILQQEVAKAAAKPYQATLPAQTPIGIMFIQPVREGDAK